MRKEQRYDIPRSQFIAKEIMKTFRFNIARVLFFAFPATNRGCYLTNVKVIKKVKHPGRQPVICVGASQLHCAQLIHSCYQGCGAGAKALFGQVGAGARPTAPAPTSNDA